MNVMYQAHVSKYMFVFFTVHNEMMHCWLD